MSKVDRSAVSDVIKGLQQAATEEPAYFETGDIVGLRSFGAKLTVIGTDGETVEVAYFDQHNVLRKEVLPENALKLLSAHDD